MIICPNCQAENRTAANFCARCGARLDNWLEPAPPYPTQFAPSPVTPAAAPPQLAQAAPARSANHGRLSAGLSISAVLMAAIFVFFFSLTLSVNSLVRSALDKDLYTNALADQGFYDDFPKLFSEQMNYWINTLKSTTFMAQLFFQNVAVSDWKLVAENILTPDWVSGAVESLFSQLFAFANGDQEELTLTINLEPVKGRLGGQVGIDTYHEIVAGKPECSQLELLQWMVAPVFNLLPICKMPARADIPLLTNADPEELLADVLKDWASSLPGEKNLADALDAGSLDELKTLFGALRTVRTVSGVLLGVSFFFLLLTFVSPSIRSLKGWLRLWGLSFLVSGMLIVIFSVLLAVFSAWQTNTIIDDIKDILHPSTVSLIEGIANQVMMGLVSPIVIPAGILVVAGFAMFGASVLIQSRSSPRIS